MGVKTISTSEKHADTFVIIDDTLTSAFVTLWEEDGTYFAKGHAKWNPTDRYDEDFGIKLAITRATSRALRKREKALVRATA